MRQPGLKRGIAAIAAIAAIAYCKVARTSKGKTTKAKEAGLSPRRARD